MKEVICVNGLTKSYGDKVVVDKLDLSVKSGTVFGLLGANGAGKSTTIECILGTIFAAVLDWGISLEIRSRVFPAASVSGFLLFLH